MSNSVSPADLAAVVNDLLPESIRLEALERVVEALPNTHSLTAVPLWRIYREHILDGWETKKVFQPGRGWIEKTVERPPRSISDVLRLN